MLYSLSFILILPRCKQLPTVENHPKTQEETHICVRVLFIRLCELRAYYQSNYQTGYPSACHSCFLYKRILQSLPLCLLLSFQGAPSLFPFCQTLPFTSGSFLHSALSVGILKVLVCSLLLHPSISLARSLAYVFINLLYKLNGFYTRCWE